MNYITEINEYNPNNDQENHYSYPLHMPYYR